MLLTAAMVAIEPSTAPPAQAADLVSLSGTLKTADGEPVIWADVILTDLDEPSNTGSYLTTTKGAYFIVVKTSSRLRLQVRAGISGAGGTDTVILPTATFTTDAPFSLTTNRTLNLVLPPLRKVTVHVTDADDHPIAGAEPVLSAAGTVTGVELAPGVSFTLEQGQLGGNRNVDIPFIRGEIYRTTNASGNQTRWSFPGTFGVTGSVLSPPINGFRYRQQVSAPIPTDTTSGDTTIDIQRPALAAVSGTLRTADSKPVIRGVVELKDLDDPTNTSSFQTKSDGKYFLLVRAASRFEMGVRSPDAWGTGTVVLPDATFTSEPLTLSANRTINLTLPPLRKVTVHITDNDDNPIKGAEPIVSGTGTVADTELSTGINFALEQSTLGGNRNIDIPFSRGEIYRTTNANGNQTRWSFAGSFASSTAIVTYPPINGFRYVQTITDPITVDTRLGDTTVSLQRPALASLSGTLRAADGKPVIWGDITLTDLDDPTNTASFQTKTSGKYFLLVRPGSRFRVRVATGSGGGTTTIILPDATFTTEAPFALTSNRTLDLTLPPLRKVTVHVADAGDSPIKGAEPVLNAAGTVGGIELSAGIGFTLEQSGLGGNRNLRIPFIRGEIYRSADASGNTTRWSYPGAFTAATSTHVTYPPINGYAYTQTITTPVPVDSTAGDVTVNLVSDNFATIDSAGTLFGDVIVTTPDDTGIDDTTSTPVIDPVGVPEGAYVLAGDIGYSVTDVEVGASVDVTIALPAGATVTAVGKIIDDTWTPVPDDRLISNTGNRFVVRLTDGGWGDADGTANGTIVDPLVPVGPCNCKTPTAPGKPTTTRGDRSVTLKWSAARARGAAVRDHIITFATNAKGPFVPVTDGTCAQRPVRARTCTVTNLTPGTGYWFRVVAVNAKGSGSSSRTSAKLTAATAPGAVAITPSTVASGTTKIGWTAAPGNGAAVTRYEYSIRVAGTDTWGPWQSTGTKRAATLTKLTPATSYDIRIRAINAIGTGGATTSTFVA